MSNVWAVGDFGRVSRETIGELGERLVRACGIGPGQEVLDVAAGTGNVAIPAALAGARVVASDITPELLEAGREQAAARGAELEWVAADVRALPFPSGAFDVVTSSFGAMFAPDHEAVAAELVRVCRPGGTIGLLNWTPEGWAGEFLRLFSEFGPPPPPGTVPATAWGSEEYVRELLGPRVAELELRREIQVVDRFADPEHLCAFYKAYFGPVIVTYRHLEGQPERAAELDRAFLDMAERTNEGSPGGPARYRLEYLLVLARP